MTHTSNPREGRGWPGWILGGRLRTSTAALLIAFCMFWWLYETYEPAPQPPPQLPASEVVPPGFIPDPNYTWAPRTDVQPRTTESTTTSPTTTTTESPPPPTDETPTPSVSGIPVPPSDSPTASTPPAPAPSAATPVPVPKQSPAASPSPSLPPLTRPTAPVSSASDQ